MSNNNTGSPYHSLWAYVNQKFAFKSSQKQVKITNNLYQNDPNPLTYDVDSTVRHIIIENDDCFLILCENSAYRFNSSDGDFKKILLNLDSRKISSGIVVNEFLLLDTELDSAHELRLFNLQTNELCDNKSIKLKTTM